MKTKQLNNAKKLYDNLFAIEYDSTIEEDWTIDNESLEAELFLGLSDEGKKVYAMSQAKQWANTVMDMEEGEYRRLYGNDLDYILEEL
ncbi:hypothetical protein vBSauClo6_155 [Staphylococcus phage vB_Sau_Clo6]|nr:hypothetical protein vBSauClo6_155 [Staphylococcus phage vB_Sau_Clo6]